LRKLLPLTGIALVAAVAAGVVLGGTTPASTASGAKVMAYYDAHQARMVVCSFVLVLAGLFAVLFASMLASGRSVWDRVLVAGAGVFAAAAGLVGAANFALADSPKKISEPALQALNLLLNDGWVFWNSALGVLMIGAAGAWLASARSPRWLGRIAVVLGVALFIPFADFFAFLASGLWVVGVSVVLLNRGQEPAYAAAPSVA
jgi:hypothetical protein